MDFEELQSRLLDVLRTRVRNGALSERRLALQAGISQPHIHNVLKGKRILSLRATNQVIRCARIGVFELFEPREIAGSLCGDCNFRGRYREVPLLRDRLGPGRRMPAALDPAGGLLFPAPMLQCIQDPIAARLGPDPQLDGQLRENDLVLLDRSLGSRNRLRRDSLYVVRLRGEGVVRRLSLIRSDVLVLGSSGRRPGDGYQVEPLRGKAPCEVVQGRVVWMGRMLEQP